MSRTISRIGPVLDLFTVERPEWSAVDVAGALAAPRTTAWELLASLVEVGLLQHAGRGRYRIGWRALELACALQATSEVRAAALPAADRVVRRTGESALVAVPHGSEVLVIDAVEGTRPVRATPYTVGDSVEAHRTAVGKILLAHHGPAAVRQELNSRPPRSCTAVRTLDPDALGAELAECRRAGFALERDEHEPGISGVAAGIRDADGTVRAALAVIVPSERFLARRTELIKAVLDAADTASRTLIQGRTTHA